MFQFSEMLFFGSVASDVGWGVDLKPSEMRSDDVRQD